eukprot:1879233-Lingulodinium_polyedra.AAC.1
MTSRATGVTALPVSPMRRGEQRTCRSSTVRPPLGFAVRSSSVVRPTQIISAPRREGVDP